MRNCKYCYDEICVNADCPMCADYCPVPDIEGVCRYEERDKEEDMDKETLALGGVIRAEAECLAKLFAICLGNNADVLANEICRRIDEIHNKLREREE